MDKRTGNRPVDLVLLLGDCLTAALLLAGSLFTFLSAYGIDVETVPLLAGAIGFAVLAAALWSFRWGRWAALGLGGLWGLLLWAMWDRLVPALDYLGEATFLPSQMPGSPEGLLPTLLLLTAGLALVAAWLVVRVRCWYLGAALALLPALPAMLAGTLPDLRAMLAATVGWGCLLLTALFTPRNRRRLGLAVLLSQGSLAALLAGLFAVLPMEGYQRPQWATDARQQILNAFTSMPATEAEWEDLFSDWTGEFTLFPSSGGWGSASLSESGDLDLYTVGPRQYSGRTVLTVATDQDNPAGRVYLRGTAAGVYTGHSWEEVDEKSDLAAWNQEVKVSYSSFGMGEADCTMTIHHIDASGTAAYYPYRLLGFLDESVFINDRSSAEKTAGLEEYQVSYAPIGPESESNLLIFSGLDSEWEYRTFVDSEWEYRTFAYEHYTGVRTAIRRVLEPLLDRLQNQETPWPEEFPMEYRQTIDAARRTASLLSELAVYDLNVPAMEEGEDFVEHFLAEGRGYCVHFATLGALLLRLEGIPARFVCGYVADLDNRGRAAVRDSGAHAWVEIYLDGYGWYPVEMTPGYRTSAIPGGAVEVGALLKAEESAEPPAAQDPAGTPEPTPAQSAQPSEDTGTRPEAPEDQANGDGGGGTPRKSVDLTWLARTGHALLPPAALLALYRGMMALRRRRREQPDANRSAIAAYRRGRRLLFWGQEADEVLEHLARKAKFSQHTLTAEERATAWEHLDRMVQRTEQALPWWKRWCFLPLRPLY